MKYTEEKLKELSIEVSCIVEKTFVPIIVANGPNNISIKYKPTIIELVDLKSDVYDKVVDMLIIKLRKEKLNTLNNEH